MHTGDPVWRELAGDVFSTPDNPIDSFNVYHDDSETIQQELERFLGGNNTADVLIVLAPVWLILFVQLTQEPFYRFHLKTSEKIITPLLGLGDPLKFMYAVAGSRHPEGTRAAAGNGR